MTQWLKPFDPGFQLARLDAVPDTQVLQQPSCRHREPAAHFCSGNNARPLRNDDSAAQEHEIRNRLNPELGGDCRVFLGVDFED